MTILRAVAVSGVTVALSLAAVPGTRTGVAEAVGEPVRGLDISAYQHAGTPIDWGLLAGQGVRFIAVKVSEGTYYLNPYYKSDARGAAAAGLRVMPYVFANPVRSGGAATASFAVRAVGAAPGSAGLPLVVDLENDPYKKATDCYGIGIPAMVSWITGFTARAEALTGKWPIIYTTTDWWQECTGSTGGFRRDPLWLAAFGATLPTVPSAWPHWTFWQYDNAGFLPGIGQTDLDYYQPTSGLPALRPAARPRPAKEHVSAAKPKRHGRANLKATGSKATGLKTTGLKATGSKATGLKATGLKATGSKATGKSHLKGKNQHKKQVKGKSRPKPGKRKHHGSASPSYPGKFARSW